MYILRYALIKETILNIVDICSVDIAGVVGIGCKKLTIRCSYLVCSGILASTAVPQNDFF